LLVADTCTHLRWPQVRCWQIRHIPLDLAIQREQTWIY